jgi:glyoxylase-like metal-dependent hydrolase (beta-lactamase superfamily II)
MCLYEPEKKLFFCGDHILFDITPNITYWSIMKNSLGSYFSSLDRVYPLDTELVLPGHRNRMKNHRKRIEELRRHHAARLDEVLAALETGSKTAYGIAPYLRWDIVTIDDSWDAFPPTQKWFAIGETLAHLIYLEEEHKVKRVFEGNKILFSLA